MKNVIYIIILLFLPISSFAQLRGLEDNRDALGATSTDKSISRDSSKHEEIKNKRISWRWKHEGAYREFIPIDTLQDGIHNMNYIFKKSISNTYLGNFPSPYISNIFEDRETKEDFYQLNILRAFLRKPEDINHLNTTTPISKLTYFNGGGTGETETVFKFYHTQNIKPYWNAGMRYELVSSNGKYMNQDGRIYNFSVFSSYEKERMAVSLFLNQNNAHIKENGGIDKISDIRDTVLGAKNLAVKIANGVSNHIKNMNLYGNMQYSIGKNDSIIRGKDTLIQYPFKLSVTTKFEDNTYRFYQEKRIDNFYKKNYISPDGGEDISGYNNLSLRSKFIINQKYKRPKLPGLYAGIDYEYIIRKGRKGIKEDEKDLTISNNLSSAFIGGGLFNTDTNTRLNYDINARLGATGHYKGDFNLNGELIHFLDSTGNSYFRYGANISKATINPFFIDYVGNHDLWHNTMKPQSQKKAFLSYTNKKYRTELKASVNSISNYVYLDNNAMPNQYSDRLVIFTAMAKQTFKLGNFYFSQNIVYQKTNNDEVISLPEFSVYSHNYYEGNFFKDAIRVQLGIDLFYNTSFYANSYSNSIMNFYNQRDMKVGNYPKFDVFATFKIQSAILFVKYEHANERLGNRNYFSSPFYPINPATFKFGLTWELFY